MVSGVVMLIASFLPFFKIGAEGLKEDLSWSAWSNALSLFPLATISVLLVIALAVQVAVARFSGAALPERVAGFGWPQIRLLVGVLVTLTMLAYLFRSFGEDSDATASHGIGNYLAVLAGIGVIAGALMERSSSPASSGADPASGAAGGVTPGDWVLMASGVVLLIGSFLTVVGSDGGEYGVADSNAWGEGYFPLFVLPALLGVVVAVVAALQAFTGAHLPDRVLGVSWREIDLSFAGWAALMMICFLIGKLVFEFELDDFDIPAGFESQVSESDIPQVEASREVGFWVMLIASLGLSAGAFMRYRLPEREAGAPPPPPPPPPA